MRYAGIGLILITAAVLLLGGANPASVDGGRPAGSLKTIFAYDDGWAGNMFDIIPASDMQITAIAVNTKATGTQATIDVWYRPGTCVGFEDSSVGWTLIGSYSGTGASYNQPTIIDTPYTNVTFLAGQTYGIYVDLTSYATTGTMLYTAGGPNTYSNSDLTLITHCGKGPGFSGSTLIPRIWNGIIFYDDPVPDFPRVDVTCNGEDAGVVVPSGVNARIDFEIYSGLGAGVPADIWVVLQSPFGFFSYDSLGPFSGWNRGLTDVYSPGPLFDLSDTTLDRALPAGSYRAYVGIDTKANGVLDPGSVFTYDSVDFKVQ